MWSLVALPDGRLASGSYDNSLGVWDLGNGACDRVLEGHKSVREGDQHVYIYKRWMINRFIIMNDCMYF